MNFSGFFAGTTTKAALAVAGLLAAGLPAAADTYTYKYVGPTFVGGTDHIEIAFTATAPLAPATSYLDAASAGVVGGTVGVVGPNGPVAGFPLPITTFQILTGPSGTAASPSIASWFVMSDANTLTGTAPTMTGTDFQAYSMNTLAGIPGAGTGAPGLVTGAYDYDQATKTSFYASCSGIPGCTLAGNGQPYVSTYGGIVNPSRTSSADWTMTVNVTNPGSAPLNLSGSLGDGTVGVAYTAHPTATGGKAPYRWTASGLPAGLSIDRTTGAVTGTPTAAGASAATVTVTDAASKTATLQASVLIAPSVPTSYSCTPPAGAQRFEVKARLKKVGHGAIVVGTRVLQVPACAKIQWNDASGFKSGQVIDAIGYRIGTVSVATALTVN